MVKNKIVIYLRKSRNDNQFESVEEVLGRHETQLQQFMLNTFGEPVIEENIYREVVSGETIDNRPVMKRLLKEIESGLIEAVVVIEPQRLSRGSMIDIGVITNTLQYSNTKVITPLKTYDLTNKFDRKMFESELLRGNEYLEYVKEILTRGRKKSCVDGLYIGSVAPFGYDRKKLKKGYTLEPNEDAINVQYMFIAYLDGMGTGALAQHLNALGIKSKSGSKWSINMVRNILTSEIYTGILTYGKNENVKSMVNGEVVKSRKRNKDYLKVQGLHDPLVPHIIFEEVQTTLRARLLRPIKSGHKQVNALSGFTKCAKCGRSMLLKFDGKGVGFLKCNNLSCNNVSSKYELVEQKVIEILKQELKNYKYYVANYESESKENDKLINAQLKKIDKEMEQFENDLRNALINFNRKLISDKEYIYLREYTNDEIKRLNDAKKQLTDKLQIDKANDKRTAIPILEKCIDKYPTLSIKEKNLLLQSIVERIEYSKDKPRTDFKLEIFLRL